MNKPAYVLKAEVSDYIYPWLIQGGNYQVTSVFKQGCNLARLRNDAEATLPAVSQTSQLIYLGPAEPNYFSAIGLQIKSRVQLNEILQRIKVGDRLQIKDLSLNFYSRPQVFQLKFDEVLLQRLSLPTDKLPLAYLRDVPLEEYFADFDILNQSGFAQAAGLAANLQDWQQFLKQGVTAWDGEHIHKLVRPLIGNGMGLTPSGDDFLQGMLIMAAVFSWPNAEVPNAYDTLKAAIRAALEERSTTQVSLAYYQAVLSGYVNQPWLRLRNGLMKQDLEESRQAISELSQYGHSSGRDMLLGALSYLRMLQEWETENE